MCKIVASAIHVSQADPLGVPDLRLHRHDVVKFVVWKKDDGHWRLQRDIWNSRSA